MNIDRHSTAVPVQSRLPPPVHRTQSRRDQTTTGRTERARIRENFQLCESEFPTFLPHTNPTPTLNSHFET